MCLTEPHCGTDLGLLRSKAEPQPTAATRSPAEDLHQRRRARPGREHRAPGAGAPARRAGRQQGHLAVRRAQVPAQCRRRPGERNAIFCGALEHKMGIHGNATCQMNLDGATGTLVGEPNKGLAAMFVMMNAARLGVGNQSWA
jgi:alkylation response protein AidB-like acyl-CoA dehydrogenase